MKTRRGWRLVCCVLLSLIPTSRAVWNDPSDPNKIVGHIEYAPAHIGTCPHMPVFLRSLLRLLLPLPTSDSFLTTAVVATAIPPVATTMRDYDDNLDADETAIQEISHDVDHLRAADAYLESGETLELLEPEPA